MSSEEELLRQTLAKVRDHIEPSPDVLEDIRTAVARAERRRRLVALIVSVAILVATFLILFLVVSLRAGGADDVPPHRHDGPATVTVQDHQPKGNGHEGHQVE